MSNYSNYLELLEDYNNLSARTIIPFWNAMCVEQGIQSHIYFFKESEIDDLFPVAIDYDKAVAEKRIRPGDFLYFYNSKGNIQCTNGLGDFPAGVGFDDDVFFTYLKDLCLFDSVYLYISEHFSGQNLCALWNYYCEDTGRSNMVFANPDKFASEEDKWVQIKDGIVSNAMYSDELMDLGLLAHWIKNTVIPASYADKLYTNDSLTALIKRVNAITR